MDTPFSFVTGAKTQNNQITKDNKNNLNQCIEKFSSFLNDSTPNQIKNCIISLSLKGKIEENLIRPTSWKILLNTLPSSPESTLKDWIAITFENRQSYHKKIKKNFSGLKKISGDPLGGSKDEQWNKFFEDSEIKKIICLDVNRTYQERDLFCLNSIKDILNNVLFLWSKENTSPSYRQGMNEILAVLLYALYPFYFNNHKAKTQKSNIEEVYSYLNDVNTYKGELYEFFHDEKELESDLYYLFTSIMKKGVSKFFESSQEKSSKKIKDEKGKEKVVSYLLYRIDNIYKKLKAYEYRLYNHFYYNDIDCGIVLQRWLKCLFNREFHPKDVEIIWDAILSNEVKEGTSDLEFVDYFAVGMLTYIKDDLIHKEENEALQRLFHYPPIESTYTLVKFGLNVRNEFNQSEGGYKVKENKEKENTKTKNEDLKENNNNVLKDNSNQSKVKEGEINANAKKSSSITFFLNSRSKDPLSSNFVSNSSKNYNIKNNNNNNNNNKKESKDNISSNLISNELNENKLEGNIGNNESKIISEQNRDIIKQLETIFKKYKGKMNNQDSGRASFLFDQLKNCV